MPNGNENLKPGQSAEVVNAGRQRHFCFSSGSLREGKQSATPQTLCSFPSIIGAAIDFGVWFGSAPNDGSIGIKTAKLSLKNQGRRSSGLSDAGRHQAASVSAADEAHRNYGTAETALCHLVFSARI